MTGPQQDDPRPVPVTPARRERTRPGRRHEQPEVDEELADLERGRTAALLSTLGRMQLRLDLLAREQREALASLQSSVEAIERRLAAAETPTHPAPPPTEE